MRDFIRQKKTVFWHHASSLAAIALIFPLCKCSSFSQEKEVSAKAGRDDFQLLSDTMPPFERSPWHPNELFAIAGSDRGALWGDCTCLAFSPDGKFIAQGDNRKHVFIWNSANLQPLHVINVDAEEFEKSITAIAFSIDGKKLAISSNTTVWLYSFDAGKARLLTSFAGHSQIITSLGFSADGNWLASGSKDETIRLWNLSTQAQVPKAILPFASGEWWEKGLVFSPEANHLACRGKNGSLVLWDIGKMEPREIAMGTEAPKELLGFVGKGRVLVGGTPNHGISFWEKLGDKITRIKFQSAYYYTFAPEKETFATLDSMEDVGNRGKSLWRMWSWQAGNLQLVAEFESPTVSVTPFVIQPGSNSILATEHSKLQIWDWNPKLISPRLNLRGHGFEVRSLSYSADGKMLATGDGLDGSIRLWDITHIPPVEQSKLQFKSTYVGSPVDAIAISPDGRFLAASGGDTVRLWDLTIPKYPEVAVWHTQETRVRCLAFSPSGKTLAWNSHDPESSKCEIALWKIDSKDPTKLSKLKGTNNRDIYSLAFSPNEKRISFASDSECLMYDLEHPKSIPIKIGNCSYSLAFSPDGKTLAATESGKKSIILLDLTQERPQRKATLDCTCNLRALTYTPDGRNLAAVGGDDTVFVWDARSLIKRFEWNFPGTINSIAISSDSGRLATANGNGTAYIFGLSGP